MDNLTEEEIIELYEERLAIMQDGNSRDLDWFDTNEVNRRLTRAAYFDTRRKIGDAKMPRALNPDLPQFATEPQRPEPMAMRKRAEHIDFGFLTGVIKSNPKAMPSNLDAIIERRGRFLVWEFKRPDETFGVGQRIMLERLATVPNFEVWVVTGTFDCRPIVFETADRLLPNGMLQTIAASFDEFCLRFNGWHDRASR
jgi:hypothetical protein